MKYILLFSFVFSLLTPAQINTAYNPMTAEGASGIYTNGHILYWQNPTGVQFNQVFFSNDSVSVANLNPAVMIKNGSPDLIFNSAQLDSLNPNTKYFWRIVEHYSSDSSFSPVWHFRTQSSHLINYDCHFSSGLEGWLFKGPLGINNWYWYSGTGTGSGPGELVFRWDPIFDGDSYMMSPEIPAPAGLNISVQFRFYEDWWSNYVTIGCAYTLNNGYSWTSIWEITANGNVGPEVVTKNLNIPGNFRLGFYFTGNSNDIDFYRIDDVLVNNTSIAAFPPSLLRAEGSANEQKIMLYWNSGWSSGPPVTGYYIQRKAGLPTDNSSYITIDSTDENTFSYQDMNVQPGSVYTYRISSSSLSGSFYGNEASGYVHESVPVEMISFTSAADKRDIILNWKTASETNNSGFEIERSSSKDTWKKIAFIEGAGTTPLERSYSYTDKNLGAGSYAYRLKQIDFDGSYTYTQEVEADVTIPQEFALFQNYPNPFNPVTTIQFSLPSPEYVVLNIYNLIGEEVISVVSGVFEAGVHKVVLNAEGLSSGAYFYKLTAGNFTTVRKLQVLK